MAAFRGTHVSPAKHSYASVTDGQTDGRTDRRTTDKVIPMCRYASQATQKFDVWSNRKGKQFVFMGDDSIPAVQTTRIEQEQHKRRHPKKIEKLTIVNQLRGVSRSILFDKFYGFMVYLFMDQNCLILVIAKPKGQTLKKL